MEPGKFQLNVCLSITEANLSILTSHVPLLKDVGEIWVSKKAEYEVSIAKPEDTWIGVTNVRFEYSNDEYARLIGWYKTTVGDVNRVYTSLRSALRAYDKFTIESKGKDKVSAKELNFPEEHL